MGLLGGAALYPPPAAGQPAEPSVSELQREIDERDAVIRNLVQRVETLERRTGSGAASGTAAAGARKSTAAAQGVRPAPPQAQATVSAAAAAAGPATPASAPAAQPAGTAPPAPSTQTTSRAPGQFDVDEQAAERALERT